MKELREEIKRPVSWNAHKVITEKRYNANESIRKTIDSSCHEISRLFVLVYEGGANRVTADSHRRSFLPRVEIKNYNTKIDGRNYYDQPINNQ